MPKSTKKTSGMDLGKILLWSAVLVESPRWAGAMLAADVSEMEDWLSRILNIANAFAGFAMGLVVVVATAYLLDALRKTKPTLPVRRNNQTVDRANLRFWGLLVFVGGLLALTPFVLGPYIVSRMTGKTIAAVLGEPIWQFAWAVAVVIAPAFVVGGVAFAQPGLVKIGQISGETPESSPVSSKNARGVSGKAPAQGKSEPETTGETSPVYQNFGDVPESDYPWMVDATTRAIVRKYRLDGADPGRKARDWKSRAEKALGNGHELQQKLPMEA